MNGEKISITELLSSTHGFSIPVYQREYQWKTEQCKQLYDDLVSTIKYKKSSHFFGSIVDASDSKKKNHYIIIDGQQRITTISILLLAIRKILQKGILTSEDPDIIALIDSYLIEHVKRNIKLTPAHNSRDAYLALFNEDDDKIIPNSKVTANFKYFYDRILHRELNIDELLAAIEKLHIIDIFLEDDDDPQLIFESLNSTGIDLSESDKIRNFILMSLDIEKQESYYLNYWNPIEENTDEKSDLFLKDYLTIKLKRIPTQNRIYEEFKQYAKSVDKEELLKDMKKFSKYFRRIVQPQTYETTFKEELTHLNHLDINVSIPFIMELLEGNSEGAITIEEVKEALLIIENYLVRRVVCNIASSGLNKVFTTLYKDTIKLSGNITDFIEKLKYIILNKEGSASFPDDTKFRKDFMNEDFYGSKNIRYLFYILERLDRFENLEVVDIEKLKLDNRYSIEHVMPQTLSSEWIEDLGGESEARRIHEEWLNRIANLTITAYNSNYSNYPFDEKKKMDHGYKQSPFYLTRYIAEFDQWTEKELKDRNAHLTERAFKIWKPLTTSFIPEKKFTGSEIQLSDDINLLGKTIVAYKFDGQNSPVKSWKDFYIALLQKLHQKNPTILTDLSIAKAKSGLESNFVTKEEMENSEYKDEFRKVDDDIYVWAHNDTNTKVRNLIKCLDLFNVSPSDITITLSNQDEPQQTSIRSELIYKFWEKAIPVIQESTQLFKNRKPSRSTWINAGANISGGLEYTIIFTSVRCSVGFDFNSEDSNLNLKYFDSIYQYKKEIDEKVGLGIYWYRNSDGRRSYIRITNENLNIYDESCWDDAISFISGNLATLYSVLQPVLEATIISQSETGTDNVYSQFWKLFMKEKKDKLSFIKINHVTPHGEWYVESAGNESGMRYFIKFNRKYIKTGFQFDSSDKMRNREYFDAVSRHREEIERVLPQGLGWIRDDTNKRSVIQYKRDDVNIDMKDKWNEVVEYIINYLGPLYEVLQPVLNKYKK